MHPNCLFLVAKQCFDRLHDGCVVILHAIVLHIFYMLLHLLNVEYGVIALPIVITADPYCDVIRIRNCYREEIART